MARRVQTFVVTVETAYKDSCGNPVDGFTPGDIRSALWKGLPVMSENISVLERGDLEVVKD